MRRVLLATALLALAWVPAAAAHGGGVPGYKSTVTSVTPTVPGVTLTVKDGDDRLHLENRGSEQVIILGYQGEPYVRIGPGGVYRNVHSPATYLNGNRFGIVPLPSTANPKLPPEWQKLSSDPVYEWHDHRIHWMSPVSPPRVRADPAKPHHVCDWKVSGTADGKPFVIAGSLDYSPPGTGAIWLHIAAPIAALCLVGGILAWRLLRRREASTARRSGSSATE